MLSGMMGGGAADRESDGSRWQHSVQNDRTIRPNVSMAVSTSSSVMTPRGPWPFSWLIPLFMAAPGLRVPGAWSAFELVVRTIVGQQVSVKAATTIIGRLVERAGERIEGHAHAATAWRFPTPQALAAVDLTAIGMPGKRIAALQGFAHAVAQGMSYKAALAGLAQGGGVF